MFRKLFGSALLVVLFASCGGGDGVSGSINVGNLPPSFTSPTSVSVPEDTTGVIYTATARDMNNDPLTFSLLGGPDGGFFSMTPSGGLSFSSPPDFEVPGDVGGDNTYDVQIGVSDGFVTTAMFVAVTVTDRESVNFRVRRVIAGLPSPVFVAGVPDNSGRVFVGELAGRIRMLNPSNGTLSVAPFLDLRTQLSTNGERGLLGFATAPDYAATGVFYVFVTDPVGTIEVRRYRRSASDPDVADPATMEVILRQPHPLANHNGGWIGFGPDGMLFVAIGDGGGSGDPDNNAQNLQTWLGKILRIDVSGDDFPGDAERNYAIPEDNPFATTGGLPEIWAYGLRNPFRASVYVPPSQPGAGVLIIGDVGQDLVEEIDVAVEGGQNFGWSVREGTRQFKGPDSALFTSPAAEYLHGTGTRNGDTVIGGLIYRGPVELLRDLYFFGDFIRGNLWTIPRAALFGTTTVPSASFTVGNTRYAPDLGAMNNIVAFGEDQQFNLYIVDMDGEIFVIEAAPGNAPAPRARSAAPATPRHWCEEAWDGRTLRWRRGELILGGEGFTCVRKYNERRALRGSRFDDRM